MDTHKSETTTISLAAAAIRKREKKKAKKKLKKIGQKHPEFELSYDMMLGIRYAVSLSEKSVNTTTTNTKNSTFLSITGSAQSGSESSSNMMISSSDDDSEDEELLNHEFNDHKKYKFPSMGSETTPVHNMRDFKFKDYCPQIFRQLREWFKIATAEYLVTICGDFKLLEFISNSKSGQFFFFSHNSQFIIKTMTKTESNLLRKILPSYFQYVSKQPDTLLPKFYGMHRVKRKKQKIYFLIQQNVFYSDVDNIHDQYDLKGSTQGRRATKKERKNDAILKDLDFIDDKKKIKIGKDKAKIFLTQLKRDVQWLARNKIMDYSLLVGIHYRDQARQSLYMDSSPELDDDMLHHKSTSNLSTNTNVSTSGSLVNSMYVLDHSEKVEVYQPSLPDIKEQPYNDVIEEEDETELEPKSKSASATTPNEIEPVQSLDIQKINITSDEYDTTITPTPSIVDKTNNHTNAPVEIVMKSPHTATDHEQLLQEMENDVVIHSPLFGPREPKVVIQITENPTPSTNSNSNSPLKLQSDASDPTPPPTLIKANTLSPIMTSTKLSKSASDENPLSAILLAQSHSSNTSSHSFIDLDAPPQSLTPEPPYLHKRTNSLPILRSPEILSDKKDDTDKESYYLSHPPADRERKSHKKANSMQVQHNKVFNFDRFRSATMHTKNNPNLQIDRDWNWKKSKPKSKPYSTPNSTRKHMLNKKMKSLHRDRVTALSSEYNDQRFRARPSPMYSGHVSVKKPKHYQKKTPAMLNFDVSDVPIPLSLQHEAAVAQSFENTRKFKRRNSLSSDHLRSITDYELEIKEDQLLDNHDPNKNIHKPIDDPSATHKMHSRNTSKRSIFRNLQHHSSQKKLDKQNSITQTETETNSESKSNTLYHSHHNDSTSNTNSRLNLNSRSEVDIETTDTDECPWTNYHGGMVYEDPRTGIVGNEIYFVGLIDILQKYNKRKKLENWIKKMKYDSSSISATPPAFYANRMVKFFKNKIV